MVSLYGGIEAGGTKFVCGIGNEKGEILVEASFLTTTPQETVGRVLDFFQTNQESLGGLAALGIATFGPINLKITSPTYGYITKTPKPGWSDFDFVGTIQRDLNIPIGFDTDVNGAALGEHRWGAAIGLDTFLYLTIGTGIGGGGLVNGHQMHGLIHPEMGHIRIPHDWEEDPFPGVCSFHGDCLEGLANGPAIEERWGKRGEDLSKDHPAWDLEAQYLALGMVNFICTLSPQRILLGGGVVKHAQLFPLIQQKVQSLLNGYMQVPEILDKIDHYILPASLGYHAGVLGAIALAMKAEVESANPG